MIIHTFPQRTEEWYKVKRGKFSPSNFNKLKMSPSTQGYNDLINQIVYERLTGKSVEHYVTPDMERGTELEPEARESYEMETFNKVKEIGCYELDEWVCCSPDGIIGEDGMLEIKCPKWNTHLSYKLNGGIPDNYVWQMQGQMLIADKKWVDFYSYHPELEPHLFRFERDDKITTQIRQKLDKAIQEVQNRITKLKEKQ